MRGLQVASEAGVTTILNPAPAADLPDGMLALCDYITPNETEASALSGLPVETDEEAEAAGRKLLDMGVRKAVILTLGARGALVCTSNGAELVPAIEVEKVVETTGAGDAFNGSFAVALSEGRSLAEAARFGCATAGLSVQKPGAAASMPGRDEIDAALDG